MALSAWQVPGDQAQAAVRLKPDPDDKNVSPEELSRYAVERGLEAPVLHGGSLATLERLVSMGIPVILETWFVPDPGDEMGHYRLLVGYRDGGSTLLFYDSYLGPDLAVPAAEVDRDWRAFNRLYVPVYPPERGPEVRAAVGPGFDDAQSMWTLAAAAAQAETLSLDDAFAHFNLGTSLAGLGDMASAAAAFDRARERGLPWRMLWYQHAPFAVYAALDRWADVAALADANLRNAPNLEESLLWRAAAAEATQGRPQAIEDVARALRLNPLYAPAAAAQAAIEAGEPIGQALVNAGAGLPARALSPSPSQADGADAP
jgi:tetratricopeptide (TPR) repeat protein